MKDTYEKWDICIADVPFEDLPESKVRPVLVLEKEAAVIKGLKMTGQQARPGEYKLVKWKEAGLKKPTVVRVEKKLQLPKQNIRKKIGHLLPVDIVGVQKAISDLDT